MIQQIEISVYGAASLCHSCLNTPSSKDTYEWLVAAIQRKYPKQAFKIVYVDISEPQTDDEKLNFSKRMIKEDMLHPVVVINGKIIAEGNPLLKTIYQELEKYLIK